jgi:hypothetical protein
VKRLLVLAAAVVAVALAVHCDRLRRTPDRIVIATMDRARADHLTFHGYPRPASQFLVQIAEEGFPFERAYSGSPDLPLALASLNIERTRNAVGGSSLFERLRASGYETATVTDDTALSAELGVPVDVRPDLAAAVAASTAWLNDPARGKKVALWLHMSGAKEARGTTDLDRLSPIGAELRRFLVDRQGLPADARGLATEPSTERARVHDARIYHIDRATMRFYKDTLNRRKPTIWLVTACRGEALDREDDGVRLDEGMVRVPLIAWFSDDRNPGKRLTGLVRHRDVWPTLAQLGGVSMRRRMSVHGRSFANALQKKGGWAGTSDAVLQRLSGSRALVAGSRKIVARPDGVALYDITRDPLERTDLSRRDPGTLARMRRRLERATGGREAFSRRPG